MNLKRILKHALALVPTFLPQGKTAYTAWMDEVLELYGFPLNDGNRYTLSGVVTGLPPSKTLKSKFYFGRQLKRFAANEFASMFMQDIYAQKVAARKAAAKEAQDKLASDAAAKAGETITLENATQVNETQIA